MSVLRDMQQGENGAGTGPDQTTNVTEAPGTSGAVTLPDPTDPAPLPVPEQRHEQGAEPAGTGAPEDGADLDPAGSEPSADAAERAPSAPQAAEDVTLPAEDDPDPTSTADAEDTPTDGTPATGPSGDPTADHDTPAAHDAKAADTTPVDDETKAADTTPDDDTEAVDDAPSGRDTKASEDTPVDDGTRAAEDLAADDRTTADEGTTAADGTAEDDDTTAADETAAGDDTTADATGNPDDAAAEKQEPEPAPEPSDPPAEPEADTDPDAAEATTAEPTEPDAPAEPDAAPEVPALKATETSEPSAAPEPGTPEPADTEPAAPEPSAPAEPAASQSGTPEPADTPEPATLATAVDAEPVTEPGPVPSMPAEVRHAFPTEAEPAARPAPDPAAEPAAEPSLPAGPEPSSTTVLRRPADPDRRHTLTFLAVFLTVVGVGLLAYTFWLGMWAWPFGSGTTQNCVPGTPTPTAATIPDTSVRVFNATDRVGLALNVGRELQHRGFLVPLWDNDPASAGMKSVAEVRYGPEGLLSARTVAAQVNGRVVLVLDETREGSTVDLVLGNTYRSLRSVKDATKLIALPTHVPDVCPADTPGATPGTGATGTAPAATPTH